MNARQPASVHCTPPAPSSQHPSKQEHLACDLASPKPPGRIQVAPGSRFVKKDKAAKSRLSNSEKIRLRVLKEAIAGCGERPPASNHIPIERGREYAYRLGISDGEAMATRAVSDLIGRRRPVAFVVNPARKVHNGTRHDRGFRRDTSRREQQCGEIPPAYRTNAMSSGHIWQRSGTQRGSACR
jgi:hypothetical protein